MTAKDNEITDFKAQLADQQSKYTTLETTKNEEITTLTTKNEEIEASRKLLQEQVDKLTLENASQLEKFNQLESQKTQENSDLTK